MTTDPLYFMTDSDWEELAEFTSESAAELKARLTTVNTLRNFLESLLKISMDDGKQLNERWKASIKHLVRLGDQNTEEIGTYSLDSLLNDMTKENLHSNLWSDVPPVGRELGDESDLD